jgi:hypothetical protein
MTTQSSTLTEEVKFWLLRTAQGCSATKKGVRAALLRILCEKHGD